MKATTLILLMTGVMTGFSTYAAEPGAAADPAAAPAGNIMEAPAPALTEATEVVVPNVTTAAPAYSTTNGLRLNYQNAPLENVLKYLGDAAGYTIVMDRPIQGRVTVMSGPNSVTKEEAVNILNMALKDNGYTAMTNGNILKITTLENARMLSPVVREKKFTAIPKNEDVVTQIIPVDFIGAAQLMNNLIPLLPPTTQVTANEGANAIIITDSQSNIRRAAEIIAALDLPADSRVVVKVKLMKFADAKNAAQIIKDLFTQDQQRGNNNQPGRINFGGGGGRGGGGMANMIQGIMGGGAAGGQSGPSANPRAPVARVNATSDDRANAVVVSAPEDVIQTIIDVLDQIDTDVEDVTELRAFPLKNADPVETCDLLLNIFPDDTRSDQTQQRGARMVGGRGGGGMPGMNTGSAGGASDRMKKMGRVLAVPEPRTGSIIVSAAHEMMIQIAALIEQIDASDRRHQKVFVYQLKGNVQQTAQMLQDMLGSTTSRNNNNNQDMLQSRIQAAVQNVSRNTGTGTSIGSSGTRSMGGGSTTGGM